MLAQGRHGDRFRLGDRTQRRVAVRHPELMREVLVRRRERFVEADDPARPAAAPLRLLPVGDGAAEVGA